MKCKADGCDRDARYRAACMCQKHYFRVRRYGTLNLTRKPARAWYMRDDGYRMVYVPGHPMICHSSYAFEHRVVLYDDVGADAALSCELCAKALSWKTVQVDHIDRDKKNNLRSNLRPLCRRCNTWRDMSPPKDWNRTMSITFDGVTLTPTEWARDPRIDRVGATIRRRVQSGMSPAEALFGPKVTHNGKVYRRKRVRAEAARLRKGM